MSYMHPNSKLMVISDALCKEMYAFISVTTSISHVMLVACFPLHFVLMHTSVMHITTYQVHIERKMPESSFQGHHRERIFTSTHTSDLLQEEEECQRVRNISTETFLFKVSLSIPSRTQGDVNMLFVTQEIPSVLVSLKILKD